MTGFTVEIDQNTYLPAGVGRVDAIVTVQAPDTPVAAPPADGLEIIILDCSTSMSGDRISAARRAAAEAIAQVRDGVAFAVIAGTATAEQVYPATGTAIASGRTRAEATATGAAAAGQRRHRDRHLADPRRADRRPARRTALRHAILLTDGQNGEPAAGVPVRARRRRRPVHLRLPRRRHRLAGGRAARDRVGPARHRRHRRRSRRPRRRLPRDHGRRDGEDHGRPGAAALDAAHGPGEVRQAGGADDRGPHRPPHRSPATCAATTRSGRGARRAATTTCASSSCPAWSARPPWPRPGSASCAATRCSARATCSREWTDDTALSTRISRGVALYTGQAELAEAIQEGLAAQERGDVRTATARLGRAVELAARDRQRRARRGCWPRSSTSTAATGTVRLRAEASKAARMTLDSRSTVTVRVRGRADEAVATCPAGHESATTDYCDECGVPMTPPPPAPPCGAALPGLRRGARGRRPVLRGLRARLDQAAARARPVVGGRHRGPGVVRGGLPPRGPRHRVGDVPAVLPAAHVPTGRGADDDRAPQPLPRRRAGDRPVRPAARPRRLHAARRAAGGPGRRLGPRRRRLAQRHRGQRLTRTRSPRTCRCASSVGDRIKIGAWTVLTVQRRSVPVDARARAGAPGSTGPASARRSRRGCRPHGPAPARR